MEIINEIEDELIFENEDEEEDLVPTGERKLFTDKADRSLSDLFRLIEEETLILRPNYQRDFIWSSKQMAVFIESLLIKIPIPTIFFAENPDGTFEVIDGQQRLTSIHKFMKNELILKSLKALPDFNGKKYSDFDVITKRKFDNSTLFTVTVLLESTPEIKFDIFSRINQGSVKLNDQELRNVIYRGYLIEKIEKFVNENSIINKNFKVGSVSKKRKTDMEFVLRLISLKYLTARGELSDSYNGRIGDSITLYLEAHRDNTSIVDEDIGHLEETIELISKIFKGNEFRIYNFDQNQYSVRMNKAVADLQYIVFSEIEVDVDNFDAYEEKFNLFVRDNLGLFKSRTGNTSQFKLRLAIIDELRKL